MKADDSDGHCSSGKESRSFETKTPAWRLSSPIKARSASCEKSLSFASMLVATSRAALNSSMTARTWTMTFKCTLPSDARPSNPMASSRTAVSPAPSSVRLRRPRCGKRETTFFLTSSIVKAPLISSSNNVRPLSTETWTCTGSFTSACCSLLRLFH